MKRYGILLFLFVCTLFAEAGGDYLYRVHVGSFKREETPKTIRTIPNLKKYVLPEGYYCFFSGGYYLYFEGALRQLKKVHAKGFKNATIRVFKNEKLLSVMDGLDKIEEESISPTPIPANQLVTKQIFSVDGKKTLRNRADLYKEIIMPELTDTTSREGLNIDLDIDLDWKLRLKKFMNFGGRKKKDPSNPNSESKNQEAEEPSDNVVMGANASAQNKKPEAEEDSTNTDESEYDEELLAAVEEGIIEEEAENVIEENDEKMELSDKFVPTEKPIFKIYLTSTKEGMDTPMRVKYVPDIVYTYQKKKLTLYTVGYYSSSAEAAADLAKYRADGFYNAKIIGLYKTVVVSKKIADEILVRVNNAK